LSNDKQFKCKYKHAVGQDSETENTEHCPKYKQNTITQIHLENRPNRKTNIIKSGVNTINNCDKYCGKYSNAVIREIYSFY